jgi:HD-like signal output (HDOD) protein
MTNLETLLGQVKHLPALPAIYIQLSDLLDDENSTAQQIGDVVQTDPSITSRILKMVNSAYYGLPQPVSSISQTVALLGSERLKLILLGAVLGDLFRNINNDDFSIEDFWQQSIKTAIIARHLAMQNAQIIKHDDLFTAGLLHDIGRLVIAAAFPDQLAEVESLKESMGIDAAQAEIKVFGFTYPDVSEALLQKWDLPAMLIHCVKNYRETDHEGRFAIASSIIYLADQLSNNELPSDEEDPQDVLTKIPNWQQTKCTAEQICTGWQLAEDQVFEVMESFGMNNTDTG